MLAPPLLRLDVPSTVEPSMNSTLPVIVPEVPEVTFAVMVTDWPKVEGLTDELIVVVVETALTVCVIGLEVLPAKLVSPL